MTVFEISKGSLGAKPVKVLLSPEQALFYKKKTRCHKFVDHY